MCHRRKRMGESSAKTAEGRRKIKGLRAEEMAKGRC